jgi:hypothetical protein
VGTYVFDDGTELRVGDGHIGAHTRHVYEVLTGIQRGKRAAPEGWLFLAHRHEATRAPRVNKKPPAASKTKRPAGRPARSSARPPATRQGAARSRR